MSSRSYGRISSDNSVAWSDVYGSTYPDTRSYTFKWTPGKDYVRIRVLHDRYCMGAQFSKTSNKFNNTFTSRPGSTRSPYGEHEILAEEHVKEGFDRLLDRSKEWFSSGTNENNDSTISYNEYSDTKGFISRCFEPVDNRNWDEFSTANQFTEIHIKPDEMLLKASGKTGTYVDCLTLMKGQIGEPHAIHTETFGNENSSRANAFDISAPDEKVICAITIGVGGHMHYVKFGWMSMSNFPELLSYSIGDFGMIDVLREIADGTANPEFLEGDELSARAAEVHATLVAARINPGSYNGNQNDEHSSTAANNDSNNPNTNSNPSTRNSANTTTSPGTNTTRTSDPNRSILSEEGQAQIRFAILSALGTNTESFPSAEMQSEFGIGFEASVSAAMDSGIDICSDEARRFVLRSMRNNESGVTPTLSAALESVAEEELFNETNRQSNYTSSSPHETQRQELNRIINRTVNDTAERVRALRAPTAGNSGNSANPSSNAEVDPALQRMEAALANLRRVQENTAREQLENQNSTNQNRRSRRAPTSSNANSDNTAGANANDVTIDPPLTLDPDNLPAGQQYDDFGNLIPNDYELDSPLFSNGELDLFGELESDDDDDDNISRIFPGNNAQNSESSRQQRSSQRQRVPEVEDSPSLKDIEGLPESEICIICVSRKRDIVMVPCGHMCVCRICAENLQDDVCPICRAEVAQKIRTFKKVWYKDSLGQTKSGWVVDGAANYQFSTTGKNLLEKIISEFKESNNTNDNAKPKKLRILDLGCGSGGFLKQLYTRQDLKDHIGLLVGLTGDGFTGTQNQNEEDAAFWQQIDCQSVLLDNFALKSKYVAAQKKIFGDKNPEPLRKPSAESILNLYYGAPIEQLGFGWNIEQFLDEVTGGRKFDIIILSWTMLHLVDPLSLLANSANRLLRDEGGFVICNQLYPRIAINDTNNSSPTKNAKRSSGASVPSTSNLSYLPANSNFNNALDVFLLGFRKIYGANVSIENDCWVVGKTRVSAERRAGKGKNININISNENSTSLPEGDAFPLSQLLQERKLIDKSWANSNTQMQYSICSYIFKNSFLERISEKRSLLISERKERIDQNLTDLDDASENLVCPLLTSYCTPTLIETARKELGLSEDFELSDASTNLVYLSSGIFAGSTPVEVKIASAKKFAQASTAGEDLAYGAVGEFDYYIDGDVYVSCESSRDVQSERKPVLKISELLDLLDKHPNTKDEKNSRRYLDLGTGDGKYLRYLNEKRKVPWKNIVGVTAEDMRNKKVLSGDEYIPFDPGCPEESYVVANIENLGVLREAVFSLNNCGTSNKNIGSTDNRSQQFHVITSWVTFIWLSDALGTLVQIYNEFLAPGGIMILGGLQLMSDESLDLDTDEEKKYLFSWVKMLKENYNIQAELIGDAYSGVYCWILMHKPNNRTNSTNAFELSLAPEISYTTVHEDSNKVYYSVNRDSDALKEFHSKNELPQMPRFREKQSDGEVGKFVASEFPLREKVPDFLRTLKSWLDEHG